MAVSWEMHKLYNEKQERKLMRKNQRYTTLQFFFFFFVPVVEESLAHCIYKNNEQNAQCIKLILLCKRCRKAEGSAHRISEFSLAVLRAAAELLAAAIVEEAPPSAPDLSWFLVDVTISYSAHSQQHMCVQRVLFPQHLLSVSLLAYLLEQGKVLARI